MLDVVAPNQPYSVADFQAGAYAAIDDIIARGKAPFLVGGSGLYVRAVDRGLCLYRRHPRPRPAGRAGGQDGGRAVRHPAGKDGGHPGQRGGETTTSGWCARWRRALADGWEAPQAKPRYRCLLLGVSFPREKVCQRIDDRLQARIDAGMIQEVADLPGSRGHR